MGKPVNIAHRDSNKARKLLMKSPNVSCIADFGPTLATVAHHHHQLSNGDITSLLQINKMDSSNDKVKMSNGTSMPVPATNNVEPKSTEDVPNDDDDNDATTTDSKYKFFEERKFNCRPPLSSRWQQHVQFNHAIKPPNAETSILKILALQALEIASTPTIGQATSTLAGSHRPLTQQCSQQSCKSSSSCVNNKEWVQCSGHAGAFVTASRPDTILKKMSPDCDNERHAYAALMKDAARDIVPNYFGEVLIDGEKYIELEDLLPKFGTGQRSIMDIKMGTRTFLESEVNNSKARQDLYEKMVKIDANEPTEAEHKAQAITKLRYMQFREQLSSSSTLGFRIEGAKCTNSAANIDYKVTKDRRSNALALDTFLNRDSKLRTSLITKLKSLRNKFKRSKFFARHEVIGSSFLIIHDGHQKVGVWAIDFAKTVALPDDVQIDHRSPWTLGNHEDGYLFGLDNLINVLESCTELNNV